MDDPRHGFPERLFNEQSKGLRKFFRNRVRKKADVPDGPSSILRIHSAVSNRERPEAFLSERTAFQGRWRG